MKRLFAICCFVVILSTSDCFAQTGTPYKANYSSDFSIGSPSNSAIVLNLWKDWDDNQFKRHDYFADTIVMYMANGMTVRGKDSALAGAMKYRGSMSSANSTVQGWVPLDSKDQNQKWVAIWGSETDTYPDGKTQTSDIHEIWRFNKDGKIDFMKQFTAQSPEQSN